MERPIKSRTRFCPLLLLRMFRTFAKNHKFWTTCLVGTALGSSLLLKKDNRYPSSMFIHIGLNLIMQCIEAIVHTILQRMWLSSWLTIISPLENQKQDLQKRQRWNILLIYVVQIESITCASKDYFDILTQSFRRILCKIWTNGIFNGKWYP